VKIAKEWCKENGIEYIITDTSEPEPQPQPAEDTNHKPPSIAVTMATMESHNHIVGDIERGVKVYNGGGVEVMENEPNCYLARVPHKGGFKTVSVSFTNDGQDLKKHYCHCTNYEKRPPICRHVVATVLAIQGGIVESKITLGKTGTTSTLVTDSNTARAVGSGDLDVYATPMMIALMESAACKCLSDCLDVGQTSVGNSVNVEHTAASMIGAKITATATIDYVSGRKIEFSVTASEGNREIGKGKHTRTIVDIERFMKKRDG
jgi:predicted thioesterase